MFYCSRILILYYTNSKISFCIFPIIAICNRSTIIESAHAADIACTTHSSCVVAICNRSIIIVSAHAADIGIFTCTSHSPCVVAIADCFTISSAHAAHIGIFTCTSHSPCIVAIADCSTTTISSAHAADIVCTTHSPCAVAIADCSTISSAHAADIVCATHSPCVIAIADCSTTTISSAHAANTVCATHSPCVIAIADCSIIVSAHAADITLTFYIRVDDTNILNGCVFFCHPEQANKILCFIVKIQSANRMVLSIKCAIVRNSFFRSIIVSIISIPNREPFSYIFTGFCHGAFIHNNVIHQYRIGGFVSISSIDIFHKPVEVTSICNLIYALHQFRFFVGITDCAEAIFVKVMLNSRDKVSISCSMIIYSDPIQYWRHIFPDFLSPNLYSRVFLSLLE